MTAAASLAANCRGEIGTCDEALGAVIGHVIIIASLVEHAADHVHPRATCITCYPPLLLLIIILPLFQLALANLQLQHTKH